MGYKTIKLLLFLLIASSLLSSCVPSSSGGKRNSKSSQGSSSKNTGTPGTPTFPSSLNFFQNGTVQSSSGLSLNLDFSDNFYLRGSEVNSYISAGRTGDTRCLIAHFPSSIDKQLLVLAAIPNFFFNFSTNAKEYYYLLRPADTSTNKSFCQTAGVITNMAVKYPAASLAYSFSELCPSCSTSATLTSQNQNTLVYSTGGAVVSEVNTTYLSLFLSNNLSSTPTLSCGSNTECISKGYDCCSAGQCVNDLQLKSGVDTASVDYLAALADIQSNSSNIYNYPNFYHICSNPTPGTPGAPSLPDPSETERKRLEELEELYKCTTSQDGEMSLCTVTVEDYSSFVGTLETGADDLNFSTIYSGTAGLPFSHSIERITYAGVTLYSNNTVVAGAIAFGASNDNFTDTTTTTVTYTPPSNASHDDLKIRYRVDGSCEKISSSLAKCTKHYIQGNNTGSVQDHFPASNQFNLPFYADTTKVIKVEVDEVTRLLGTHWQLVTGSPAYIEFQGSGLQVFDTQEVKITYYVNVGTYNILGLKQTAQERINQICSCGNDDCWLEPVLSQNITTDYSCVYPEPDLPPPPLQQTVFVSAKSTPHRYFDNTGLYHSEIDTNTPSQEGTKFEYTSGNLLRPNNTSTYIGFNEIYGSYSTSAASAMPAKEVRVVKGKTYDIFTNTGNFSSCFYCGTDYYTSLAKLFPDNFIHKGGGYLPQVSSANQSSSTTYRADDLLFGRACFVPATMLPWTHTSVSDRQQQRLRRLKSQHFLFANGYNRDWYGFDYGALIGSFDGVRWFAVGNQRRIKATTGKLFLAINAYFGDLTSTSSYSVTVSDASNVPLSGSTVTTDYDNDGAQCQQYHSCSTDQDCAAQLGWGYACESISSMTSRWPAFDDNAQEIPDTELLERLQSIFANGGGPSKRCVYRGRGAPCTQNYNITLATNTYNQTANPGLHSCNANSYCQSFLSGGLVSKFNTKISRYGKSIQEQNLSSTVTQSDADTFGLGARLIGRPLTYNGSEQVDLEALTNFSQNKVNAICIPGRDPNNMTLTTQNSSIPGNDFQGDQVTGIGMTKTSTVAASSEYLSSCSVFDGGGDYYNLDSSNLSQTLNNATLVALASTQAMSTNSLAALETLSGEELLKNFDSEHITSPSYQPNRCLRAPGSTCFKDADCAPNKLISDKIFNIDSDDTLNWTTLNKYEIQFWQEQLVCSQEYKSTEASFDLGNNRCCRETSKTLSIGSLENQTGMVGDSTIPVFDNQNVPATGIALASASRYSRISTVHNLMNSTPATYPKLEVARDDRCSAACVNTSTLSNQFNTFNSIASKTCCSGNWIRKFHDQNGGGHTWSASKMQNLKKTNFKCLNWVAANHSFSCAHTAQPDDPNCSIRSISNSEASVIFEWLGKLELLGIGQIAVESDGDLTNLQELECQVMPTDQSTTAVGTNTIIPNFLTDVAEDREYTDGAIEYYSAKDMDNFSSDLRPIFSPDETVCCIPSGTTVSSSTTASQCCSGFINSQTSKCALQDYTNVSVYFNRYVSSEAKDLAATLFDSDTGYLKSPTTVELLACQKNVCASGKVGRGVTLSNLKVPGHETDDYNVKRFLDGNNQANNFNGKATLYDNGLRWNDHVYCVPSTLENDPDNDIYVVDCNQ